MSRRTLCPIQVDCDGDGRPLRFRLRGRCVPVNRCAAHWREWIGALDGEPERDVWRVETPAGVCELHGLRAAACAETDTGGPESREWVLFRWED